MKKYIVLLLLALFSWCVGAYELQTAQDAAGRTYQFTPGDPFGIHIYTLKNGMLVYLVPNSAEPRIKIYTAVHAGSVNDPEQSTGLAHYLEHMLFKGTKNIGSMDWEKERPLLEQTEQLFEQYRAETDEAKRKAIYAEIDRISNFAAQYSNDEYWQICREMGSKGLNAFTSLEVTAFECDVPSAFLRRYLTLETERFSNPVLRRFHTELETVYEEFNRSQDEDGTVAVQMIFRALYPKSPLGRPVIGLPEHLKNPSMKDVYAFYHRYYVPENMALIVSGSINEAETMDLIEKTYGTFARGPEPAPQPLDFAKDAPLTKDVRLEVTGPEDECIVIAYRFKRNPNTDYLVSILDEIFDNGQTGILDTDLRMNQKIQAVNFNVWRNSQDFIILLEGTPLLGQSLEDVEKLLLAQIEKAKRGEFKQENISAIVNQDKLALMVSAENYVSSANVALRLFREYQTPDQMLNNLQKASNVTVEQLADFARKNLTNTVTLYKRKGPAVGRVHTVKPAITPVKIAQGTSPYAKKIAQVPATKSLDVQVLDYDKLIQSVSLKGKNPLKYVKNEKNGRFTLAVRFPFGSYYSKFADLAFAYATFLGTTEMTPNELNQVLYECALSIDFSCGSHEAIVSVSGLDEMLPKAVEMLQKRMTTAKTDENAFKQMVQRIKQERQNQLTRADDLSAAAITYSLYGSDNARKHDFTTAELEKIKPDELTAFLNTLLQLPHSYEYYGPSNANVVADLLNEMEKCPAAQPCKTQATTGTNDFANGTIPTPKKFVMQPPTENTVYAISIPDSTQISIQLMRTDEIKVPAETAFAAVFNGYASRFFFSELREKRSLGYVAYGWYSVPKITPENYSYWGIEVGTQSDKAVFAMETMLSLANKVPMDEEMFKSTKANILTKLQNIRLQPKDYIASYRNLLWLKRPLDCNARDFKTISAMSFEDFSKQITEHTQRSKNIWLLCGNFPDGFNFEPFKAFGKVVFLTPDDVFVK